MSRPSTWQSEAVLGFSEFADGALWRACEFWMKAEEALNSGETSGAACLAFVQNNIGVAFLLHSEMARARAAFDAALSSWSACKRELEQLDLGARLQAPRIIFGSHFDTRRLSLPRIEEPFSRRSKLHLRFRRRTARCLAVPALHFHASRQT